MNISDHCHSVKIVIEQHAQVRKFLVCLIFRGEDAIICGIEIKKMSHLLLVFEVEISAFPQPQESMKLVRLESQLAEESAELILSSSYCNTTSPIRLRSFLLSCLFLLLFLFLRFNVHESEPSWKSAGHSLALQPSIFAVALLGEAIASLVLNQTSQLCWEVDTRAD